MPGSYSTTRARGTSGAGVDPTKDQSYVLFGLRRELLSHVLLPVGGFPKSRIRELAKELNLPVHDKPDSQEICFVPDDDYLSFVRARRPELQTAGPLVDHDGTALGQHSGMEAFTIGQRRGLGVAVGQPRYVVQIEPSTKTVTLGPREALLAPGLEAGRFNWQVDPPATSLRCLAQIRSKHQAVAAIAEISEGDRVSVRFDVPQSAVTPGQVVTLYDGDRVLGGGWIDRAISQASDR